MHTGIITQPLCSVVANLLWEMFNQMNCMTVRQERERHENNIKLLKSYLGGFPSKLFCRGIYKISWSKILSGRVRYNTLVWKMVLPKFCVS